uniref:Uncharacterized protein n=1 Tax=Bionectria ochroleuca TaxID=29856 RepID=A0A8H7NQR8_BIOOC
MTPCRLRRSRPSFDPQSYNPRAPIKTSVSTLTMPSLRTLLRLPMKDGFVGQSPNFCPVQVLICCISNGEQIDCLTFLELISDRHSGNRSGKNGEDDGGRLHIGGVLDETLK